MFFKATTENMTTKLHHDEFCDSQLEHYCITSPNHPDEYPNNKNCSWLISAKESELIELTLEDNGYELEDK